MPKQSSSIATGFGHEGIRRTGTAQDDLTRLVDRAANGEPAAERQVINLLREFADAKFLRFENPGHSLQKTLLADEAFVRLFHCKPPGFANREHFYRAAADVIRHYLVDRIRQKRSLKRGGRHQRIPLSDVDLVDPSCGDRRSRDEETALALDRLAALHARAARVVTLRHYGGLTSTETAAALGVSEKTVYHDWVFARAWLARELSDLRPAARNKPRSPW